VAIVHQPTCGAIADSAGARFAEVNTHGMLMA
jgi:hypothetical protein